LSKKFIQPVGPPEGQNPSSSRGYAPACALTEASIKLLRMMAANLHDRLLEKRLLLVVKGAGCGILNTGQAVYSG
jgi:hypothetical protein